MSDYTNCTHTQLFPSFWRTYIYFRRIWCQVFTHKWSNLWSLNKNRQVSRDCFNNVCLNALSRKDWEPIPVFAWLVFSDPLKTLSEGTPSTLQSGVSVCAYMRVTIYLNENLCSVCTSACLLTYKDLTSMCMCVHACLCVCVFRYRAFPPSSVFTQQISLTWLLEESFISKAFPERQNGLFTSGAQPKSWNCYYYYIYLQN